MLSMVLIHRRERDRSEAWCISCRFIDVLLFLPLSYTQGHRLLFLFIPKGMLLLVYCT